MAAVARPLILILLLISTVEARILSLNSSDDELISDGINGAEPTATTSCRHQYGFLPCAENVAGYIFMIVVYQVLLIVGDMLIGSGSEVLFYITGPKFGGILFRILRALPSMTLVILSGIYSNKQDAQSQVSVVVGVYAGVTVFGLTVQWFMCMVSASKPLKEETDKHTEARESHCFPAKVNFRILIDNGVKVDDKTCKTAGIMLLSLIPYLVLQLVYVPSSLSGKRVMTLIALIVSSLSVVFYFAYQIHDPWMQKRSLDYSKFDIVQRRLVQHVERLGKLVKEDGTLNVDLIRGFFDTADKNDDRCIAAEELDKMVSEVFKVGKTEIDQNEAMNQVIAKFDNDKNKRISEEEFIEGFKKWIHDVTHSATNTDFNPSEMLDKASRLLEDKKCSSDIDKIMSKILKKAEGQLMRSEALITHDGEPNIERIQRLFKEFDSDGDRCLTTDELRELISKVKFGTYQMKEDVVIKEMFRAFDLNNNDAIDEDEFLQGMKAYIEKAMKSANTSGTGRARIIEEFDKYVWDQELHDKKAFLKSLFQVVLGIAMLTFLAGPLMSTILELSNAMNFPSFIISFVAVPLAMNARAAIAAILPASKKRDETASLTFSEIYGGVIMNNISGLTTLLAIVYAKDLTWDFSAEVLTILVVCGIIGVQAFLNTTYHLWTCITAILLYPISLGLFYVLQTLYNWN